MVSKVDQNKIQLQQANFMSNSGKESQKSQSYFSANNKKQAERISSDLNTEKSSIFQSQQNQQIPSENSLTKPRSNSNFSDLSDIQDEEADIHMLEAEEKISKNISKGEIDQLELLCINCQEYVKFENTYYHSQVCNIYKDPPPQYDFEAKLWKLIFALDEILERQQDKEKYENLVQLKDRIQDVISACNYQQIYDHMQILLTDFVPNHLQSLIYAKRAQTLCKDRLQEMHEEGQSGQLKDILIQMEKETKKKKMELQILMNDQLNNYIRANKNPIGQIKSNCGSDSECLSELSEMSDAGFFQFNSVQKKTDQSYEKSSYSTKQSISSPTSEIVQQNQIPSEQQENSQDKNKISEQEDKELRRQFYTAALSLKLQLPKSHPCHNLVISDLYDKAQVSVHTEAKSYSSPMDKFFGKRNVY